MGSSRASHKEQGEDDITETAGNPDRNKQKAEDDKI